MSTFVLGDIHGGYKALLQVLERSSFNKDKDTLIFLGDVVDGWSQTKESVEELLNIKNLITIKGNHDEWFENYLNTGHIPHIWISQGGKATLRSYDLPIYHFAKKYLKKIPDAHKKFFRTSLLYYYDEQRNYLFTHGGVRVRPYLAKDGQGKSTPHSVDSLLLQQHKDDFLWDRSLIDEAWLYYLNERNEKIFPFIDQIFIGHTSTLVYQGDTPICHAGIIALDTGGGWHGKLTIMDIDTKEYWQSDTVKDLYPNEAGRR